MTGPVADAGTASIAGPVSVDARRGLTSARAADIRNTVGPNVLATHQVTSWTVLTRQLRNPLLILLLAAAAVSGLTGDPTDAGIIAAIVVLSVGLGFFNEYRSELAVAALHANISHRATVLRDGEATRVDVADIVPGDVVELHIGDVVPADLRLFEVNQLECDEAVLTGESMPAEKTASGTTTAADTDTCDAFMGTVVHHGTGRGLVVSTGSSSEFGKIAAGLSERETETAFQAGLRGFSGLLVKVAAVLTTTIFVVNVAFHRPVIDSLLFSLAIAIGITPQLLPAIVSISLSTGSRRLASKRVLVKRLVTIEDLGNVELLFTDKTGTLTDGQITFDTAVDTGGAPSDVVRRLGLVCNEVAPSGEGPAGGNALDQALWATASPVEVDEVKTWQRVGSVPFDHERQMSTVLVSPPGEGRMLVTKGAPEIVLARCDAVPDTATAELASLFARGARVVAVATRDAGSLVEVGPDDEHGLLLAGFVTFVDPPKSGADRSVARLADLGIDVRVITGDNGVVAEKLCRDIGIRVHGTVTGDDLASMDDDQLAAILPETTIFARTGPGQKARVIKVARRTGVDVAFLGDGVNDAVALHAADVGISVDSAAEVARDAADIVLLDKDLGVLADGVAEGRRIFANTLKYVLMATSSNFGNMFSAAGASLVLGFLPMLPSQILLNNLLYDVGQMAIPSDRVDPETVRRPSAWDIAFVRRFMYVFGPLSSIFDFATFFVMLSVLHAGHTEFRTGWFVESLATQTLVIYIIRTRRVPFFRSRPSRLMIVLPVTCALIGAVLPFSPLADVLGFTPLPARFFAILVGMIVLYLVLVEFAKSRFYARQDHPVRQRPSKSERHRRRVRRRAWRFTHHRHLGRTGSG